jgi:coenzyme F420-reducing hydrogenase delta subunit/Pyruvate/2-oxoacid:ferredoxin oxidoreductase delta subunit
MLKNFSPVDHLLNKVYTSRWNPLYQSGALAMFLFLVVAITGCYLLLFYDVGNPHTSVEGIWNQVFFGRWIRSVHRYASDAAVVAIAFHALKMFMTGRSYGKRLRAWASGWILLFGVMVCGWTGFLLVWDLQAQWLALELSRIFDVLPIFSAPLPRIFSAGKLPSSFFFSLLFLHVAVPLGLLAVYLLHTSRVARPTHKPPLPIRYFALAGLLTVAVLWPVKVDPISDPSKLLGEVKINIFYTGLLPLISRMPVWAIWAFLFAAAILLVVVVPLATKPKELPKPSWVDPELCTGCTTCFLDCPYEAISMIKRSGEDALDARRSEFVANVNSDICVSCGICAGSCAPMGVGPPERTGRSQLSLVKSWFSENDPRNALVVIACDKSFRQLDEPHLYFVGCIGSLHTSVIEWLIRKGAAGVFVLSCPERDCHNREGPKWSHERIYNEREAELQERVDRDRVRTRAFARTEMAKIRTEIAQFRQELESLNVSDAEATPEIDLECPEKIPVED